MVDFKSLLDSKEFLGVLIVVDKNLKIVEANNKFLDLLGYSNGLLKGKQIVELIVPSERNLFLDMVYKQDVSNTITLKFYHKSGAFRFFSIAVMNFGENRLIFGTTVQKKYVTSRYEFNSDLSLSIDEIFNNVEVDNIRDLISFENNPVSLILHLLPVEIWVKDKYGKYLFANEQFLKATNKTTEEYYMKDDFQIFDFEVAKSFVETDEEAIKLAKKLTFSFEVDHKDLIAHSEVTKIPIYNKTGKYIGIVGFSLNITHIISAEKKLEEESRSFKHLVDNIEGLIFEINNLGYVTFVSGKLSDKLGFKNDSDEIVNIFEARYATPELKEKVKLALNGVATEINSSIANLNVVFRLNPFKNEDGTYTIAGQGFVLGKEE